MFLVLQHYKCFCYGNVVNKKVTMGVARIMEGLYRGGSVRKKMAWVDARRPATTNRNLEVKVYQRRFRADRFHHLNGYRITGSQGNE